MTKEFYEMARNCNDQRLEMESLMRKELRKMLRWYFTTTRYPDGLTQSQLDDLDVGFAVKISELSRKSYASKELSIFHNRRRLNIIELNESRTECYLSVQDIDDNHLSDISLWQLDFVELLVICQRIGLYLFDLGLR